MRFQNRRAVITGAAGGIGRACVERFEREGARVLRLDLAEGCDVRSEEQVRRAAETFGVPDVLVHCVATTAFLDTLSTARQEWLRILEVNVWGVVNVCRVFVPAMRARRSGSIVIVSSITGIVGAPGLSAYAASKGALITLARTLALELAPDSIRVNCVCPASVDTPMLQAAFEHTGDPARARELNVRRHPLGRLGRPEDVANLVAFLASEEASWITGGTYLIDGGASIARRWQE